MIKSAVCFVSAYIVDQYSLSWSGWGRSFAFVAVFLIAAYSGSRGWEMFKPRND